MRAAGIALNVVIYIAAISVYEQGPQWQRARAARGAAGRRDHPNVIIYTAGIAPQLQLAIELPSEVWTAEATLNVTSYTSSGPRRGGPPGSPQT